MRWRVPYNVESIQISKYCHYIARIATKMPFKCHVINEFCIRARALPSLSSTPRKLIRFLAKPSLLSPSPTRPPNSTMREHSCKVLSVQVLQVEFLIKSYGFPDKRSSLLTWARHISDQDFTVSQFKVGIRLTHCPNLTENRNVRMGTGNNIFHHSSPIVI